MDTLVALLVAITAVLSSSAAAAAILTARISSSGGAARHEGASAVVDPLRLMQATSDRLEQESNRLMAELRQATSDLRERRDQWQAPTANRGFLLELAALSTKFEALQAHLESADFRRAAVDSPPEPLAREGIGVRELSHALGAPLVQIQSYTRLLKRFSPADPRETEDFERYRTGVLSGVALCQALLTGYKRLEELATPRAALDEDLGLTARLLADFFSASGAGAVELHVDGDLKTTGYSSTLLMVLASPLLENALDEVSTEGETVLFGVSRTESDLVVSVSNPVDRTVNPHQAIADGFSTKPGHEGIGLTVIKRIIDSIGGALELAPDNGRFTARITLPASPKQSNGIARP